jgi:phosphocarrier protein HPr
VLQRELEIVNRLGLHARASVKLTQAAGRFRSEVWLTRNGRRVNAKSIMGVMMLAASRGTTVLLEVDGPDETSALELITHLVATGFGEPD